MLLDLRDLRALLQLVGERSRELSLEYGNVSKASVGAIQRRLLVLENQGADKAFFGEPALAALGHDPRVRRRARPGEHPGCRPS